MSITRPSAGAGHLPWHTAARDTARPRSTALVDYYAATAYPPGRRLGLGLTGLSDGAGVTPGSVVTEQALAAPYAGRDAVTGQPLGRPSSNYAVAYGRRQDWRWLAST